MSQLNYTLEPDDDLFGLEDDKPLVTSLDFVIDYKYTAGDPGCRYTRNGDGWPPSGPEVDWTAKCVKLTQGGVERAPTPAEAKVAEAWIEKHNHDEIVERACEDYGDSMVDTRW
jgi:hypothetical protein